MSTNINVTAAATGGDDIESSINNKLIYWKVGKTVRDELLGHIPNDIDLKARGATILSNSLLSCVDRFCCSD